jgi:hypothetical protein
MEPAIRDLPYCDRFVQSVVVRELGREDFVPKDAARLSLELNKIILLVYQNKNSLPWVGL